jgi:hypothetical protein
MKSLRKGYRPTFANGLSVPRDEGGEWPDAVIKEVDPELVRGSRPVIDFHNALQVQAMAGTLTCFLSPNDATGMVRAEERFRGSFSCHHMSLGDYPFDEQQLKIIVRLSRPRDAHRSFRLIDGSQLQHSRPLECGDDVGLPRGWGWAPPSGPGATESVGREGQRATFTVELPLARQTSDRVLLGCFAPLSLGSAASVLAFALPATSVWERLAAPVAMLACVATLRVFFSSGFSDVRGDAAEWTLLDRHALLNIGLIMLVAAGIVARAALIHLTPPSAMLRDETVARWSIDAPVALGICVAWILFHSWFVVKAKLLMSPSKGLATGAVHTSAHPHAAQTGAHVEQPAVGSGGMHAYQPLGGRGS